MNAVGQPYYYTHQWRSLARQVKVRDCWQCQICGDVKGAPYCVLHAHHRVPRSDGGADTQENVITLCDLCHAVVTRRWHKPWFGTAALEHRDELEQAREEFIWFLSLPARRRASVQSALWAGFGIRS